MSNMPLWGKPSRKKIEKCRRPKGRRHFLWKSQRREQRDRGWTVDNNRGMVKEMVRA